MKNVVYVPPVSMDRLPEDCVACDCCRVEFVAVLLSVKLDCDCGWKWRKNKKVSVFVSKLAVKKKRKPKSLFWRTKYNLICVLDCCAFGSGIWVLWQWLFCILFCGLLEYLHLQLFVCSFLNVYILMLLVFSCRWRVSRSWGVARVGSWLAQFFYLARLCRRTAKVRTSFFTMYWLRARVLLTIVIAFLLFLNGGSVKCQIAIHFA